MTDQRTVDIEEALDQIERVLRLRLDAMQRIDLTTVLERLADDAAARASERVGAFW